MIRTPGLGRIILVLTIVVTYLHAHPVEWHSGVWDPELLPTPRGRRHSNPRRNRERWLRRLARQQRQRPAMKRSRSQRHRGIGRQPVYVPAFPIVSRLENPEPKVISPQPAPPTEAQGAPSPELPDPLADLRDRRGWIDYISERELWALLVRVRWPNGPCCPHCGEDDPEYLELFDPDYRGGLGRWCCQVCAEAGDPGEGGTFTPLTGTILDGMRVDIRTWWLMVEGFVKGRASVETAKETGVHRHTTDRHFRLLRAAIYRARSEEPIIRTVQVCPALQTMDQRPKKLLDQARDALRQRGYSIHTERSYVDWMRRFILGCTHPLPQPAPAPRDGRPGD